MAELSYAQVSALLKYDSDNGVLTWLPRTAEDFRGCLRMSAENRAKEFNRRFSGKAAGSLSKQSGYLNVVINQRTYRAHRIVWLLVNECFPEGQIDHLNGNREDNRIENLRDVSPRVNAKNTQRYHRNSSGVTGVSFHKLMGKWRARITIDRKVVLLGYFDTIEDARLARLKAQTANGFSERHGQ